MAAGPSWQYPLTDRAYDDAIRSWVQAVARRPTPVLRTAVSTD